MASSPENLAIVSAVISLGHALDMKIVAEGVETEEQAAFLSSLACQQAQGFHFGRPMPAVEFAARLQSALPSRRIRVAA